MSLEAAIDSLNKNIVTLINVMGGKALDAMNAADAKAIKDAKANAADDAARQAMQDERTAATKAPKKDDTSTAPLVYDKDIKPIALALAKSNRPKLLEIYKHFGVSVGSELKPEQYAEALAMLKTASA